jgi:polyketide synthase PksN
VANNIKTLVRKNGVYLITGGAGGLGFIIASYLAKQYHAKIILNGRSKLSAKRLSELKALAVNGADIQYIAADISKLEEAAYVVKMAKAQFGKINGIIHSAGVLRDALIVNKTTADIQSVLEPKIAGTLQLDQATHAEPLDFFVLFSSIAAVFGNIGQCDYAYANSFMDAFAEMRHTLCQRQERQGKTIAINWPLWDAGGMQVDEATKAWVKENLGLSSLTTSSGIQAFIQSLSQEDYQQIVLVGEKHILFKKLESSLTQGVPAALKLNEKVTTANQIPLSSSKHDFTLLDEVRKHLIQIIAKALKISEDEIDAGTNLTEYGLDSLNMTTISNALNHDYGLALGPAILYEYKTLDNLVQFLHAEYYDALRAATKTNV